MTEPMFLRIDIEGVRKQVMVHLGVNGGLDEYIRNSIEAKLTESWVKEEIDQAIEKAIRNAIYTIGNHHQLRQAIQDVIQSHVIGTVQERLKHAD